MRNHRPSHAAEATKDDDGSNHSVLKIPDDLDTPSPISSTALTTAVCTYPDDRAVNNQRKWCNAPTTMPMTLCCLSDELPGR